MKLIGKRNLSDVVRTPLRIRAGIAQSIFLSLLIGLVYLQLDLGQLAVQDRQGALFFILTNQLMSSVVSIVNVFPEEKAVFMREHTNHMYRTTSYYVAKVMSDLPFQILYPTIYMLIAYWMIGFQKDFSHFIIFWIVGVLTGNIGAAMGLFLGIVAKDASTATALMPLTVIPFMLFSGFLVNTSNVPVYFIWVPPISPVRYGFSALILNEFTGLTFTCDQDQEIPTGNHTFQCQIPNGQTVINNLSMQSDTISLDIIILVVMYFFIRIVSYLMLLRGARAAATA